MELLFSSVGVELGAGGCCFVVSFGIVCFTLIISLDVARNFTF